MIPRRQPQYWPKRRAEFCDAEAGAMRGRNSTLLLGIAFIAMAFTISPLIAFAVDAIMASLRGDGGGSISLAAIFRSFASPSTGLALRFSLTQAALSTLIAMIVGFPGAFFVARYKFPGRRFFLSLAAVPFCLPPILVILAFILYYGKSGWLSVAFKALGFERFGESGFLYSLWGLVFVHAFYNFPIVVQNVGAVWTKMPHSREEAARTLGAGKFRAFMVGTLPYLLPSLLQSASLIFLFCFFSFTIVLVFGGLSGTTLEVGIYRAIRFTNDKPLALTLALIQTAIALLLVGAFGYFDRKNASVAKGFGNSPPRHRPKLAAGAAIALYMILIIIFFLGPLFALVAEAFTQRSSLAGPARFGFGNFARLLTGEKAPLFPATANSLAIGGAAALLATIAGIAVAAALHYASLSRAKGRPGRRFFFLGGWITLLPLALSPAIISAGWSSLLRTGSEILVVLGQTAIAWPFVARSLAAAFSALDKSKNEAARTLGSTPLHALLRVDATAISPSIASAAGFAFSITMGDVNIPLVLGGGRYETLPLLLYRLTSSYRFNEACAVGIVLALFTSIAFFLKERSNEPA